MRRVFLLVAFAALMVMASAPAFAGEVTGSGKGGPNNDGIPGAVGNGRSACLYSGLEDNDGLEPVVPGVVQNWGHTKDSPAVLDSRGASWVKLDFGVFFPGGPVVEEGCNPHVGEHED